MDEDNALRGAQFTDSFTCRECTKQETLFESQFSKA